MNRFFLFVLTMGALLLAAPSASAQNNCAGFGGCQDNDTTTITDNFSPSSSANAGALGVGLAGGGDADASSRSNASGGDAFASGGDSGVFGSGNSANSNRNLNGAAAGVLGSGNSSSSVGPVDNTNVGIQGQLGILDNTNDLDNSTNVSTSTSTSTSTQQGQQQGQVGIVKDGDVVDNSEVTVEGDDIDYEAPDIPVNSAAPVFAGACSQGVSVQTQSFGGSAGTTNPVCDYVAVAGGFVAAGERDEAVRVLGKAEDAADWRYRFSQIRSVLTLGLL